MSATPEFFDPSKSYTIAHALGMAVGLDYGHSIIIDQLKKQNHELTYQATHDNLTGLLNRYGVETYLAKSDLQDNVILYVDGTNVKAVNDKYGHQAGDNAIIQIANVLRGSLRNDVDLIARIGGDEFLAILSNLYRDHEVDPHQQLQVAVERISDNTGALIQENEILSLCQFNIAVGGAIWSPGSTIESLKLQAEKKMMEIKQQQHLEGGQYR